MYFFGHFGLSVGAAHAVNLKIKNKIDLRWAGVFGLLPDLIDKPVTLCDPKFFHYNTRALAHNLFGAILLMALFVLFSRRKRAALLLVPFYFGHLLLDRMWVKHWGREIFLFPFDGPVPWLSTDILGRWGHNYIEWYPLFGEAAGLAVLVYLFIRYRLDRAANRRHFWSRGFLEF